MVIESSVYLTISIERTGKSTFVFHVSGSDKNRKSTDLATGFLNRLTNLSVIICTWLLFRC